MKNILFDLHLNIATRKAINKFHLSGLFLKNIRFYISCMLCKNAPCILVMIFFFCHLQQLAKCPFFCRRNKNYKTP